MTYTYFLFIFLYLIFLVHEMLHTAKIFARRCNNLDVGAKQLNGLTFGEFCVLAADLKRFK